MSKAKKAKGPADPAEAKKALSVKLKSLEKAIASKKLDGVALHNAETMAQSFRSRIERL